jgi:uncharacterized coiled-coil protein SlyX
MPEREFATKEDIKRLEELMDQMQNQLIEAMQLLQKEVLRGFNNWISPMEIRLRGQEERLALLEERLRQIERALGDDSSSEIN